MGETHSESRIRSSIKKTVNVQFEFLLDTVKKLLLDELAEQGFKVKDDEEVEISLSFNSVQLHWTETSGEEKQREIIPAPVAEDYIDNMF